MIYLLGKSLKSKEGAAMIKIDIVSGFLGAGKTTMLNKLIKHIVDKKEKVVLIENEFGKVPIDADLIQNEGMELFEINQGCICCTVKSDFLSTLSEIAGKYNPDRVLFEPSGIFILEDALEILKVPDIKSRYTVNSLTTIVDSINYLKQSNKFGYFFESQIKHVHTLVLSKVRQVEARDIDRVVEDLGIKNLSASIIAKDWDELTVDDMEHILAGGKTDVLEAFSSDTGIEGSHFSIPGHGFESIAIKEATRFNTSALEAVLKKLASGALGDVVRAKGFIPSEGDSGYFEFSLVSDTYKIEYFKGKRSTKAVVIGLGLKNHEINEMFGLGRI